eukprot:scaffold1272_cov250-Pinguiococcus_pyrenoidosus.AAC.64
MDAPASRVTSTWAASAIASLPVSSASASASASALAMASAFAFASALSSSAAAAAEGSGSSVVVRKNLRAPSAHPSVTLGGAATAKYPGHRRLRRFGLFFPRIFRRIFICFCFCFCFCFCYSLGRLLRCSLGLVIFLLELVSGVRRCVCDADAVETHAAAAETDRQDERIRRETHAGHLGLRAGLHERNGSEVGVVEYLHDAGLAQGLVDAQTHRQQISSDADGQALHGGVHLAQALGFALCGVEDARGSAAAHQRPAVQLVAELVPHLLVFALGALDGYFQHVSTQGAQQQHRLVRTERHAADVCTARRGGVAVDAPHGSQVTRPGADLGVGTATEKHLGVVHQTQRVDGTLRALDAAGDHAVDAEEGRQAKDLVVLGHCGCEKSRTRPPVLRGILRPERQVAGTAGQREAARSAERPSGRQHGGVAGDAAEEQRRVGVLPCVHRHRVLLVAPDGQ